MAPISRTALENGFRELLDRTPHAEITRVRLRHAQQLLTATTLPVSQVAVRCGYERTEYFSTAFRRETGLSPSEYRRRSLRHRLKAPAKKFDQRLGGRALARNPRPTPKSRRRAML